MRTCLCSRRTGAAVIEIRIPSLLSSNHIMCLYNRFFSLLFFVGLLALLSGCGPKGPAINYVEGVVTLDGEPVDGANVSFAPKQMGAPGGIDGTLLAGGRTDTNGKYTLSTTIGSAIGGGTTIGEYDVTIVKKRLTNTFTGPGQMVGRPNYAYDVPRAFENAETSKITVEVVKGKNTINFALSSDGTFDITK